MEPAGFTLHLLLLVTVVQASKPSCCNYGTSPEHPGLSCADVILRSPGCKGQSGSYWIENATAHTVQVHCDMTTLGGGWEKIAEFQSAPMLTDCPSESMALVPFNGSVLCSNNGTLADIFLAPSVEFSEVRGTVSAYMKGDIQAFLPNLSPLQSIAFNGHFMDGVSLMLDDHSGFFKHIYSLGAGQYENIIYSTKIDATCPSKGAKLPTSIIGPHYSCSLLGSEHFFESSNPLPFGVDQGESLCTALPDTCARPSAWFYRQLPVDFNPTDIDLFLRVQSQYPSEVMLEHYVVYVR